jgi:hypothetical protein
VLKLENFDEAKNATRDFGLDAKTEFETAVVKKGECFSAGSAAGLGKTAEELIRRIRGSLPGQARGGPRRRRAERAKILVATNVAARGLDVRHVGLVVNYEPPETTDLLTHRIGRTGRMGADGAA